MTKLYSRTGFLRAVVAGVLVTGMGATLAPAAVGAPAAAQIVLKNVTSSADHDGIGVSFTYSGKVTEKSAAYLPAGEKPTQDGSGDPVKVAGTAWIRVVVHNYNWVNDSYRGPKRIAGEGAVKEIVLAGAFEGSQTWYIGVDRKRAFTDLSSGSTVALFVKV